MAPQLWDAGGGGPDPVLAFLSSTALVVVLTVLGWFVSVRVGGPEDRRFRGRIFLLSFALRLIFALVLLFVIPFWVEGHPYLSFGSMGDDGRLYDRLASTAAQNWDLGWILKSPYPIPAPGYVFTGSFLYWVFGYVPFVVRAVNAFLGALLPAFTYAMGRHYVPRAQARLAAILVAVFPEQIIYAGSDLKDISVTAAFTVGLWTISELPSSRAAGKLSRAMLLLVGCAAFLALSRFYYAFVLAFGAAAFTRQGWRRNTSSSGMRSVVVRVLLIASILIPLLWIVHRLFPSMFGHLGNPVAVAARFYSSMVVADSDSFYRYLQPPYSFILLPVTMSLVALTPFILWPFVSPDPIYTLLFPGILVWYILIPFSFYGLVTVRKQGFGRVLFVVVVVTFAVLAISGSGLGTAGRTKVPIHPILLTYAAIGLHAFRMQMPAVRTMVTVYSTAMLGGILVYLSVKAPDLGLGVACGVVVLVVYIAVRQLANWRLRG